MTSSVNTKIEDLKNAIANHQFEHFRRKRAIVIDDDENALNLMEHHLKDYGFGTVDCYTNEFKGMRQSTINPPDLLILDLFLNYSTGHWVLNRLGHKMDIELPILLVSAYHHNEKTILKHFRGHTIDFMHKPMQKEGMFQKLDDLFTRDFIEHFKATS